MKGERPLAEDELRGSLHIFFQWIPPKLAPLFCILQQVHAYPSSIQKTRHVLQSHLTPHHPFLTSIFKLETFLFQRYHFLPSHPYFTSYSSPDDWTLFHISGDTRPSQYSLKGNAKGSRSGNSSIVSPYNPQVVRSDKPKSKSSSSSKSKSKSKSGAAKTTKSSKK